MNKFVKLTKLREADEPVHPGNIDVGRTFYGKFDREPIPGERFELYGVSFSRGQNGILTSTVQEIVDANTFRTYNSIYRWEFIERHEIPGFSKLGEKIVVNLNQ